MTEHTVPTPSAATPGRDAVRARVRRSALLALPFQCVFVVVPIVVASLHGSASIPLALLLVPALWAPALLMLLLRGDVPWPLQVYYFVFMTAGPFAGSALHVYGYIPHWDKAVHFGSGIMLAWLGMLVLRTVEERSGTSLPRWFGLIVIQVTPMAFAAAWEICEFVSDHTMGTHAQLGNTDTMGDIISGTLGGLAAILVWAVARRPKSLLPPSLAGRDASDPPPHEPAGTPGDPPGARR